MINQAQLKSILHYNPITGDFTWKKNNKIAGSVHPKVNTSYSRININKKGHSAHRLAFLYTTGEFPKGQVDHIDANGLNNKWLNLRDVSSSMNRRNARMQSNNTSGITGINWHKTLMKWQVRLCGKHMGYADNIFEAACIRFSAQNNVTSFTDRHGR